MGCDAETRRSPDHRRPASENLLRRAVLRVPRPTVRRPCKLYGQRTLPFFGDDDRRFE